MNNGRKEILTLVVAAVVTTTLVSSIAHAQIRYVDDDAPLLGDGLSWDTAYRFPQDALAEAGGNPAIDEIRVAQGIYTPDRDAAFPEGNGDQTATFQLIEGWRCEAATPDSAHPIPTRATPSSSRRS